MNRLRDAPTRSGSPNDCSSPSRASAVMLCSGVLPKPMPGSSTILSREIPALAAIVQRSREEIGDVLHDVDRGIGAVAVVHDDDRRLARGDQAGHARIALQAPDVVGDRCAVIERPGDDGRFHAVDRYRNAKRDDVGQHRPQAVQFLVRRNRLGAIGPGGFRADVDDVGALGDHPTRLRQRALGVPQTVRRRRMNPGVTLSTPITAG